MNSTARKMIDWSRVDWSKPNAKLAKKFSVTKQNVAYARRRHSTVQDPVGHGGRRKGAGMKSPSDNHTARRT